MKYTWYKVSSFLKRSKIKSFGLTFESFDLTALSNCFLNDLRKSLIFLFIPN